VVLLALFQGRLAWVNAAFLVLGEGSAIIALLFEAFFVDETLVQIVDSVGYLFAAPPGTISEHVD
jgi:integral membrane sensor domain MASE1